MKQAAVCALISRCVKCVRLASGLFSRPFTQSGSLCQILCSSFIVTAFFQFLEVNGLYLVQVTLQDCWNVVLDYAEVEF